MNDSKGDFSYNGKPIFNVGFLDFSMFVTCIENNNRILTKNIHSENLREYYKKSRDNDFGIRYEGVIIDIKKLKSKDIDEGTR